MADQCSKDLPGTAIEVVAVAFDLADATAENAPKMAAKALQSADVQNAIRDAFKQFGEELMKKQQAGAQITPGAAIQDFGTILGKTPLDKTVSNLKSQIEKSPEYARLKDSLDQLECAWKKSPVGAWVMNSDNTWKLVVVGTGVVLGGAVAMYVTESGDTIAEQLTSVAKDKIKTAFFNDKLKVGVADVVFKPSERRVEARAYADVGKWLNVQSATFSVTYKMANDKVVGLGLKAELKAPLNKEWSFSASAAVDPLAQTYQFKAGIAEQGAGIRFSLMAEAARSAQKQESLGVNGSVMWKPIPNGPLDVSATGSYSRLMSPGDVPGGAASTKTDAKVMINLTLTKDFL